MVITNVTDTLDEKAWLSSCVLTWSLSELTLAANQGPIMVGVAHSDYTAAEIEEWVENTSSWEQGNKVQQEIARRKIRRVGTFLTEGNLGEVVRGILNDGKPIRTRCGWGLITGQTLKIWSYNLGSVALAGTAPDVNAEGHCNLWPQ